MKSRCVEERRKRKKKNRDRDRRRSRARDGNRDAQEEGNICALDYKRDGRNEWVKKYGGQGQLNYVWHGEYRYGDEYYVPREYSDDEYSYFSYGTVWSDYTYDLYDDDDYDDYIRHRQLMVMFYSIVHAKIVMRKLRIRAAMRTYAVGGKGYQAAAAEFKDNAQRLLAFI